MCGFLYLAANSNASQHNCHNNSKNNNNNCSLIVARVKEVSYRRGAPERKQAQKLATCLENCVVKDALKWKMSGVNVTAGHATSG